MVKKLRVRFTLTASLILLVVLTVIGVVINVMNYYNFIASTEKTMTVIAANNGEFPDYEDYLKMLEEERLREEREEQKKNEETAVSENKTVMPVLSTDKICLFTDKGNMHRVNVADMPQTKLKDKGVPIDNLGNFKSSQEDIVYMCLSKELDEAAVMAEDSLLFVTKKAFVKRVSASEFIVSKRTIAATKLSEGDELLCVINLYEHKSAFDLSGDSSGQMSFDTGEDSRIVVLESKDKYKLRFPLGEIPAKKKTAVGVRGMKLSGTDVLKSAEVVKDARGTIGHRDGKGRK